MTTPYGPRENPVDALMARSDALNPLNIGHPSRDIYQWHCERLLRELSELGFVVVRADGLEHGDTLEHAGLLIDDGEFIPQDIVDAHTPFATPPGTRVRPVYVVEVERAEPHLHTLGIDRGDCPQCEEEYGS